MKEEARKQIARLLDWEGAHRSFEGAVRDVPFEFLGARVTGFPHTLWQLVEHIRLTQADLLAYSSPGEYRERSWPVEYWPISPAPSSGEEWEESIAGVLRDRAALQALILDPELDPLAPVPHGHHALLRELLLAADHTAYHVGQIVAVRRLLGIWSDEGA